MNDIASLAAELNKVSCSNARVFEENGCIIARGYVDGDDEYTAFITDVMGKPKDGMWKSVGWEMVPDHVPIVFRSFMIATDDTDGDIKFAKTMCKRSDVTFERCNLVHQSTMPETYGRWSGSFSKEWLEGK